MILATLLLAHRGRLYTKITKNGTLIETINWNELTHIKQKATDKGREITCWINLTLTITEMDEYTCRTCKKERIGTATIVNNSIFMPLCRECLCTKLHHYLYIYWILRQYTINDITLNILRYLARPIN